MEDAAAGVLVDEAVEVDAAVETVCFLGVCKGFKTTDLGEGVAVVVDDGLAAEVGKAVVAVVGETTVDAWKVMFNGC